MHPQPPTASFSHANGLNRVIYQGRREVCEGGGRAWVGGDKYTAHTLCQPTANRRFVAADTRDRSRNSLPLAGSAVTWYQRAREHFLNGTVGTYRLLRAITSSKSQQSFKWKEHEQIH